MTSAPFNHIAFIPGPTWSHVRPAIKTSLRMVEKFEDLFISLFVFDSEVPRATEYLDDQSSTLSTRVRIIVASSSGEPIPEISLLNVVDLFVYLEKCFELWITKELQAAASVLINDRLVNKPSWIIEDQQNGGVSLACKPHLFCFQIISEMNPSRHGSKESGHGGRVFENIAQRQDISFDNAPISASALSSAFSKPITPFLIGPSVDVESAPNHPDSDPTVTKFLDRAYAEKGAHSVIYVAFGTIYFPPSSSISHLTTILNEVANSGFRFILSLSNKKDKVDQSWMDTQIQAGNAIFPKWTNQTAVLDHPAIHYFLTHSGWNSVIEALVRGVPMICWPFASDHPTNIMHIANVHDCGFELLQVRTGPAKSTAYQNGQDIEIVGTDDAVGREMKQILELSKGPRGEHQRVNARLLGKVISDSLEGGGSGDQSLEKFGKVLGLL
ncbi:hypothetical protein B0J17DRAFT_772848 [Rhizoctonia solani]|nr:hypothetical protein B0J17DRAFT_772848 [Rhizoctonia solani]